MSNTQPTPNRDEIVFMGEMTSPEFKAKVSRNAVLFIPTGATEQHGPHLPLGVDYLLPKAIAMMIAHQIDGIVAPAVPYGYKSMTRSAGGPFFAGSTGLDGATLTAILHDLIREFVRHGLRRICILDGNYENRWFLNEGIDLAVRELNCDDLKVMCLQHWEFLTEETLTRIFPDGYPGIELEHAAVLETSLMMHFYPHLVLDELLPDNDPILTPPYDMWPPHEEWVPKSGALTTATSASADKGQIIAEQYERDMVAAIKNEFMTPSTE